jgi:hypothetical protein
MFYVINKMILFTAMVHSLLAHKTSPIISSTYMKLVPAGSGPLQKTVLSFLSHNTSPIISSTYMKLPYLQTGKVILSGVVSL